MFYKHCFGFCTTTVRVKFHWLTACLFLFPLIDLYSFKFIVLFSALLSNYLCIINGSMNFSEVPFHLFFILCLFPWYSVSSFRCGGIDYVCQKALIVKVSETGKRGLLASQVWSVNQSGREIIAYFLVPHCILFIICFIKTSIFFTGFIGR